MENTNPLYESPALLPNGTEVILASASPRRRELLHDMGFTFTVIPADCDESIPDGMLPVEAVRVLSERKAQAVAASHKDALVIASDTLVALFEQPLGKPKDRDDAFRMLCEMSGKKHFVHTGVAVIYRGRMLSDVDTTAVQFCRYTPTEAWTYVLTGEPMDKAGAYGIQGLGRALVEKREGNLDTVIGFPTLLCDRLLKTLFLENNE